jgi:ABC-type Fe3+ transport system permease subunit
MRLALLDASAPRAFFFAALPTMRGPLAAACAGVFMLSAIDSTIPPLVLAPELWSVEWVARAEVAKALPNPLGQMLPPQWPMLTLVALAALAALPGLREMARWADEPEVDGDCVAGDGWLRAACSLAAAALAFLPLAVFAFGLGDGRYDVGESFGRAFAALRGAMGSTLVVAGCAAMGAFCIALAAVEDRSGPALARLPGRVIAGLLIVTAVLPPPVVATAVITVFADPWVSPRAQWNLYDDTPAPWIAGMIARFAFLPVCLVRLMNRRVPRALADLAAVDAGSRLEAVRHGRLPMLWRPALAGAAAVGVLTLSEIVASNLLRPPQWGGGSLGHLVDSYLHFGRHSQTIAMSMMMMIPAIGTAILLAGFERISVRARSGRSA